ncbi:hypothetical protein V6Z98_001087 [Aspergillus fumigatus]
MALWQARCPGRWAGFCRLIHRIALLCCLEAGLITCTRQLAHIFTQHVELNSLLYPTDIQFWKTSLLTPLELPSNYSHKYSAEMKGVITILTMAIAATALAFPHRWVRDDNSTNPNTIPVPAPILVPTPTTKLLPPSVSAATAQPASTNKALVTPAPSASPNSDSKSNLSAASKSDPENKDGKVHIVGSLMNSVSLFYPGYFSSV